MSAKANESLRTRLRDKIERVLEQHESLALDNNRDRMKLAEALVQELLK